MIDLDDLAQLGQFDRLRLHSRAAAWQARLGMLDAGRNAASAVAPGPMPHGISWRVPFPLIGCVQTTSMLLTERGQATSLWVDPSARPPGLVLTARSDPAPPHAPKLLPLPELLSGTGVHLAQWPHPSQCFLFLLGLLATDTASLGATAWSGSIDAGWLARCHPETPRSDNPAKRLAEQLYERVPLLWAEDAMSGVAQDWQRRLVQYAEVAALNASPAEAEEIWSVARFPRFWNSAICWVRLPFEHRIDSPSAPETLGHILLQRKIATVTVELPSASSPIARIFHAFELGEWVALYLAALYGVDPADAVPLQLLDLA